MSPAPKSPNTPLLFTSLTKNPLAHTQPKHIPYPIVLTVSHDTSAYGSIVLLLIQYPFPLLKSEDFKLTIP